WPWGVRQHHCALGSVAGRVLLHAEVLLGVAVDAGADIVEQRVVGDIAAAVGRLRVAPQRLEGEMSEDPLLDVPLALHADFLWLAGVEHCYLRRAERLDAEPEPRASSFLPADDRSAGIEEEQSPPRLLHRELVEQVGRG